MSCGGLVLVARLGRLEAGGLQHLAEVDNLLLAAVVALGAVEELHLVTHVDLELAAVVLLDGADGLEQADGVVPAHVVAGRVSEDRREGVGVVVVQVHRLLLVGHDCLSKMRLVVDAPEEIVGDGMSEGRPRRDALAHMAVAVGFEPTVSFHPHTLSRRAPLAARTRHRRKAYKHEAGRTESVRPAYVSARRIGDLNP